MTRHSVVGLLIALGLSACGDDVAMVADAAIRPDAQTGTDASAVFDAAVASDAAPSDATTPVDAARDAALTSELFARFLAADDKQETATCACDYASLGFDTAADCVLYETGPSARRDCRIEAFIAVEDALRAAFECRIPLAEVRAECYEAAMCDWDDQGDCDAAYNSAVVSCPRIATEDNDRRDAAYNACVAREYVANGADTCSDSAVASSALGAAVFSGTTLRAGDHRTASCVSLVETAADKTFRWTAPSAGTYVIDTAGSSFDTVLYILPTCSGAELDCNDDAFTDGLGLQSRITVELDAGETIQIVVDGARTLDAGDFVVNINPPS